MKLYSEHLWHSKPFNLKLLFMYYLLDSKYYRNFFKPFYIWCSKYLPIIIYGIHIYHIYLCTNTIIIESIISHLCCVCHKLRKKYNNKKESVDLPLSNANPLNTTSYLPLAPSSSCEEEVRRNYRETTTEKGKGSLIWVSERIEGEKWKNGFPSSR